MKITQPWTRTAWGISLASVAIFTLVGSYIAGISHHNNHDPKLGHFDLDLVLLGAVVMTLAIRSARQAVIVADKRLKIRRIFSSASIDLADVNFFELVPNVLHSTWLVAATMKDGKKVKLPFWSRTWTRDDPRNWQVRQLRDRCEELRKQVSATSDEG